jgi:predicted Holliday junction resolvase-like endonuclease
MFLPLAVIIIIIIIVIIILVIACYGSVAVEKHLNSGIEFNYRPVQMCWRENIKSI